MMYLLCKYIRMASYHTSDTMLGLYVACNYVVYKLHVIMLFTSCM